MWLIALDYLKSYWKPIALLLLVVSIYSVGYLNGGTHVQAKWDNFQKQSDLEVAQQHVAELEAAKKKSDDYQKQAEQERQKSNALNRRLANEIAKNAAYRNCHATPDVVQSYEELRTGKASPTK